jgi:hypothetical protein
MESDSASARAQPLSLSSIHLRYSELLQVSAADPARMLLYGCDSLCAHPLWGPTHCFQSWLITQKGPEDIHTQITIAETHGLVLGLLCGQAVGARPQDPTAGVWQWDGKGGFTAVFWGGRMDRTWWGWVCAWMQRSCLFPSRPVLPREGGSHSSVLLCGHVDLRCGVVIVIRAHIPVSLSFLTCKMRGPMRTFVTVSELMCVRSLGRVRHVSVQ